MNILSIQLARVFLLGVFLAGCSSTPEAPKGSRLEQCQILMNARYPNLGSSDFREKYGRDMDIAMCAKASQEPVDVYAWNPDALVWHFKHGKQHDEIAVPDLQKMLNEGLDTHGL